MESLIHRRERLILTTIDIIDELGIMGLSTREIAKRQNVSEGTIFRHFVSKTELLNAVLLYYSQFDDDIYQSTKLKKLNAVESIYFLVKTHMEYYENYPAITSILLNLEVLRYEPELMVTINNIMEKRTGMLSELIIAAQNSAEIRRDIDCDITAMMITGIIREACLKWRMKAKSFPLKEKTVEALSILVESIRI